MPFGSIIDFFPSHYKFCSIGSICTVKTNEVMKVAGIIAPNAPPGSSADLSIMFQLCQVNYRIYWYYDRFFRGCKGGIPPTSPLKSFSPPPLKIPSPEPGKFSPETFTSCETLKRHYSNMCILAPNYAYPSPSNSGSIGFPLPSEICFSKNPAMFSFM